MGALGCLLGARPVLSEGVVEELRVGLPLLGGLLGELLGVCAAGLGLLFEAARDKLRELLGALLLTLCRLCCLFVDKPV